MKRILVVEDEPDIRDLVILNLNGAGFETLEAGDGLSGLKLALEESPDLVILDLMLPDMNGEDVLVKMQADENARRIPVIMLTAKSQANDRIAGLELGADDYVTKPFSPKELVLRIQGLLKRTAIPKTGAPTELVVDEFHLDFKRLRFRLADEETDLTVTEFRLLSLLLENRGQPLERALLLYEIWGYSDVIHTRTLDTHVKRLREKLGSSGQRITTERGVGYAFK